MQKAFFKTGISLILLLSTLFLSINAMAARGPWRCRAIGRHRTWYSKPFWDVQRAINHALRKCYDHNPRRTNCRVGPALCYRIRLHPKRWRCVSSDLRDVKYRGVSSRHSRAKAKHQSLRVCHRNSLHPKSCSFSFCRLS